MNTLTPRELRLILAFRNMNAEIQRTTLRMAEHCAADPLMTRHKRPTLQLVTRCEA
jgi:hypothetical protein